MGRDFRARLLPSSLLLCTMARSRDQQQDHEHEQRSHATLRIGSDAIIFKVLQLNQSSVHRTIHEGLDPLNLSGSPVPPLSIGASVESHSRYVSKGRVCTRTDRLVGTEVHILLTIVQLYR